MEPVWKGAELGCGSPFGNVSVGSDELWISLDNPGSSSVKGKVSWSRQLWGLRVALRSQSDAREIADSQDGLQWGQGEQQAGVGRPTSVRAAGGQPSKFCEKPVV